jgi:hypothetical protein
MSGEWDCLPLHVDGDVRAIAFEREEFCEAGCVEQQQQQQQQQQQKQQQPKHKSFTNAKNAMAQSMQDVLRNEIMSVGTVRSRSVLAGEKATYGTSRCKDVKSIRLFKMLCRKSQVIYYYLAWVRRCVLSGI